MLSKTLKCVLCLFVILLMSCTQDPLKDLPQSVQKRINELLGATKSYGVKQRQEEVSYIFGQLTSENDFWQVAPGKEFRQIITANVFMDEDQFDDFHVNLKDSKFEGENYSLDLISSDNENKNEKKYLFRWTPSQSFLENYLEKIIDVGFQLQTTGSFILDKNKVDQFKLFVTKYFQSQPLRIQPIDVFTEMKEDDEEIMKVHVYSSQPPVLMFGQVNSDMQEEDQPRDLRQLLHFISKKKTTDENIWEFQYYLRTNPSPGMRHTNYALNMFAFSADGISDPYTVTLTVFNHVLIPQVIGPKSITISPGQLASIFVQVLDPLASGNLSSRLLTQSKDLPGDVRFNYDLITDGILISLHLNVPYDVDVSQNYKIEIEILNEGIENSQQVLESVVHNIQLNFQDTP